MVISTLLGFIFFFTVCYGNDTYLLKINAVAIDRFDRFARSFNDLLSLALD